MNDHNTQPPADNQPSEPVEQATEFFGKVIGPVVSQIHRLAIWSAINKKTEFFTDCESAARFAVTAGADSDVYFGTCVVSSKVTKGRGKYADMAGLASLRLEVDVAGPGHKAAKLPPDKETALRLLDGFAPRPAVVVDSGGGVHAYWPLREPWIFNNDEDRQRAQTLMKRLWPTVAALFAEHGWPLDPVHDLARVLRVPSTLNHKIPEHPRLVRLIRSDDGPRYTVDEFDAALAPAPQEDRRKGYRPRCSAGKAVSDPVSYQAPSAAMIKELCAGSETFRNTWGLNRPDFTKGDGSPDWSRYDGAIAGCMAVLLPRDSAYAWIAGAIQAFRRKHCTSGADRDKAQRADYLDRTISEALAWASRASRGTKQNGGHTVSADRTHEELPLFWEETHEIEGVNFRATKGGRNDRVLVTASRKDVILVSDTIGVGSGPSREKLAQKIASKVAAGDDFRQLVEDWLLGAVYKFEQWKSAQGKIADDPRRLLSRCSALLGAEVGQPVRQWSSGEDYYVVPFDSVAVVLEESDLDSFAAMNRKVRPHIKRSLNVLKPEQMHELMRAIVALAEDRNEHSTQQAETLAWLREDFATEPCGCPSVTFTVEDGRVDRLSLAGVIHNVRLPPRGSIQSAGVHMGDALGYLWDTDGRLYVHVDSLVSYLSNGKHLNLTAREIKRRLADLGFEALESGQPDRRLWAKDEDERIIKASVWRSPPQSCPPANCGNETDGH